MVNPCCKDKGCCDGGKADCCKDGPTHCTCKDCKCHTEHHVKAHTLRDTGHHEGHECKEGHEHKH